MPIITPAYPSMCATHNVTLSTKDTILKELKRGGDLVDNIFTGQLTWKDLFERHAFFTADFKYYLSVVSCSRTKEAQLLWSGLVESKIRHLVTDLEHDELISCARPYIEGFERVHLCNNEEEISAVMHGDLRYQAKDIKTETTEAANDPKHNAVAEEEGMDVNIKNGTAEASANGTDHTTLFSTTYYIGLQLSQRESHHLSPIRVSLILLQMPKSLTSLGLPISSRTCAPNGKHIIQSSMISTLSTLESK